MYIPIWCRPPNKLIKYYFKPFDDGAGHTGIARSALYLDKNKKEREIVTNITWDK